MKPKEASTNERSEPSYPYYDLDSAIQFSGNIRKIGGARGTVKKSVLARDVGLAESTPSFFQRLSATKVFGLIDGWGSYSLTDLGRSHFYPQAESESQVALLKAFATPKAFAFLLKRFDGDKLPSTEIIGNILLQECGVPPSWKERVAQIFIRSASYVGIIDANGFLRYDAAMHSTAPLNPGAEAEETETGRLVAALTTAGQSRSESEGGITYPARYPVSFRQFEQTLSLPLESGKVIQIPKMTEEDYELMIETLKLWKRRIVIKAQTEQSSPEGSAD